MNALLQVSGSLSEFSPLIQAYTRFIAKTYEHTDNLVDIRIEPKYSIPDGSPYQGQYGTGKGGMVLMSLSCLFSLFVHTLLIIIQPTPNMRFGFFCVVFGRFQAAGDVPRSMVLVWRPLP